MYSAYVRERPEMVPEDVSNATQPMNDPEVINLAWLILLYHTLPSYLVHPSTTYQCVVYAFVDRRKLQRLALPERWRKFDLITTGLYSRTS